MRSVSSAHQYLHFSLCTFHNRDDVASARGVFHLKFFSVWKYIHYFFNSELYKIYLYVEIAKLCLNIPTLNNTEGSNRQNVEISGFRTKMKILAFKNFSV